jgi:hypothetical protein
LFFFQFIRSLAIQRKSLENDELLRDEKPSAIEVLLYPSRISIFSIINKNALCSKFLGEVFFSSFEFLSEFVVVLSTEEVEVLCH